MPATFKTVLLPPGKKQSLQTASCKACTLSATGVFWYKEFHLLVQQKPAMALKWGEAGEKTECETAPPIALDPSLDPAPQHTKDYRA